ncbi:hypothetical protein GLOIN_2v1762622 [Rhizophagus irregularis DAOM 181602=DAOM 197198]|uniref:Uncharacterized protein n=1 Tax=Rhizophagus irregularis (strain DAOM 181602 / DAOM 197198 / MUCL 43194) TaxID=747089 RepID=U9THJ0_RHIID|nr:hypothetical protein GLOIN_2v1762622 [Rhizophagus irregularis DAOM 181602=DAOM 197198]POG82043.1 hypothetical protein GLOIN_2v1762622 [Rhizophagus irregularis DAOM 181602=DAOM 197198]CAG8652765.1 10761_t:CDS:2 [Rhizophagus irregularis]|eukprot:XP_025188909.1 hypothetical protein GLOIN_2v1762622 [Rhizophagus irregularis DAOM 181602=DAOM 197198]
MGVFNVSKKLSKISKIDGRISDSWIKDLYTEEQATHAGNFQGYEDYNEGTSDDVIEITDLEDVLANATSDNAEVIPTNGGKKQKLQIPKNDHLKSFLLLLHLLPTFAISKYPPYNNAESHKNASDDLEEIDTETLLG